MLIGGIVAAVMVVALTITLLTRKLAHDDLHSVEGYHRSIHTLESINAHPAATGSGLESGHGVKSAYPESAVRLGGSLSVRVTDPQPAVVPPVPPPPLPHPDVPLTFDDAGHSSVVPPTPEVGHRDKAMVSINHRPRRLAAPAMAVAVVAVVVVVLLLSGSHTVAPARHHPGSSAARPGAPAPKAHRRTRPTSTSTTAPLPAVSLPQSSSSRAATYDVSNGTFTLDLSATSGPCWVDATSATTGATLFAGTLQPGQGHVIDAAGSVTLIIGAPTVFVASVDGDNVVLPSGYQTPFTMSLVTTVPPSG